MKEMIERVRQKWIQSKRRVKEEEVTIEGAQKRHKASASAQVILQQAAQMVQQAAHDRIAAVVTKALQSVYGDHYEFRIHFEKKRGKTDARMVFVKNGEEEDPIDGSGGGILDVASLALRLACLMLTKPKARKLLILDEPFKNINGDDNRERAAELITALSEEFGVQIIMTTGYDWLKIGTVISID